MLARLCSQRTPPLLRVHLKCCCICTPLARPTHSARTAHPPADSKARPTTAAPLTSSAAAALPAPAGTTPAASARWTSALSQEPRASLQPTAPPPFPPPEIVWRSYTAAATPSAPRSSSRACPPATTCARPFAPHPQPFEANSTPKLPGLRRHVRQGRLSHPRRRLRRQPQRGLHRNIRHGHAPSHPARHHPPGHRVERSSAPFALLLPPFAPAVDPPLIDK